MIKLHQNTIKWQVIIEHVLLLLQYWVRRSVAENVHDVKHNYQKKALISYDDFDWSTNDLSVLAKQCDERVGICKDYAKSCREKMNSL